MAEILDISRPALHSLPGVLDCPDVEHPDGIDWRQVTLHIDVIEGRWLHMAIAAKSGARPSQVLAEDRVFQQFLGTRIRDLFARQVPEAHQSLGNFALIATNYRLSTGETCSSFHIGASGQRLIRKFSEHDLLRLAGHWREICAAQARKRANVLA